MDIASHAGIHRRGTVVLEDFSRLAPGVRLVSGTEVIDGFRPDDPTIPRAVGAPCTAGRSASAGTRSSARTPFVHPDVTIGEGTIVRLAVARHAPTCRRGRRICHGIPGADGFRPRPRAHVDELERRCSPQKTSACDRRRPPAARSRSRPAPGRGGAPGRAAAFGAARAGGPTGRAGQGRFLTWPMSRRPAGDGRHRRLSRASAAPQAVRAPPLYRRMVYGIDPWSLAEAVQSDLRWRRPMLATRSARRSRCHVRVGDRRRSPRPACPRSTARCCARRRATAWSGCAVSAALFDLVHVDGGHDSATVLRDVRDVLPRLRAGGFLVLDDVELTSVHPAYALRRAPPRLCSISARPAAMTSRCSATRLAPRARGAARDPAARRTHTVSFAPTLTTAIRTRVSAFRTLEYARYLEEFPDATVWTTGISLPALDEWRPVETVLAEHGERNPALRGRVRHYDASRDAAAVHDHPAVLMFVGNWWQFRHALRHTRAPFVFTLYPGRELQARRARRRRCAARDRRASPPTPHDRDAARDAGLRARSWLRRPGARRVRLRRRVSQPPSRGRSPAAALRPREGDVRPGVRGGARMPGGLDKGYDLLLDAARLLADVVPGLRLQVVGPWSAADGDLTGLEDRVTFHGWMPTDAFPAFYASVDAVLAPTRAGVLLPGAFDGFPSGACIEAALWAARSSAPTRWPRTSPSATARSSSSSSRCWGDRRRADPLRTRSARARAPRRARSCGVCGGVRSRGADGTAAAGGALGGAGDLVERRRDEAVGRGAADDRVDRAEAHARGEHAAAQPPLRVDVEQRVERVEVPIGEARVDQRTAPREVAPRRRAGPIRTAAPAAIVASSRPCATSARASRATLSSVVTNAGAGTSPDRNVANHVPRALRAPALRSRAPACSHRVRTSSRSGGPVYATALTRGSCGRSSAPSPVTTTTSTGSWSCASAAATAGPLPMTTIETSGCCRVKASS